MESPLASSITNPVVISIVGPSYLNYPSSNCDFILMNDFTAFNCVLTTPYPERSICKNILISDFLEFKDTRKTCNELRTSFLKEVNFRVEKCLK